MRPALVIDDSEDIRELIQHALELEGYDVETAKNGLDAQQKLTAMERPGVILLDLMMPVLDGTGFLDWKMNQVNFAEIPVVVISAVNGEMDHPGVSRFLKKPLQLEEMFEVVSSHCKVDE